MVRTSALSIVLALASGVGCAANAAISRLKGRIANLNRALGETEQALSRARARRPELTPRAATHCKTPTVARRAPPARRPTQKQPAATESPGERHARARLPVVRLGARRAPVTTARARRPEKTIVLRLSGRPAPLTGGRAPQPAPWLTGTPRERLPVVPLPGQTRPGPAVTGTGDSNYDAARALFQRRDYGRAAVAFSRFARRNPRHPHADNALYWLAESFYRQRKIRRAAWVLRKLLKRYPAGNKAPSALLKLGLAEARLGRRKKARRVLGQVTVLYRGTREARLAAAHLRRWKR